MPTDKRTLERFEPLVNRICLITALVLIFLPLVIGLLLVKGVIE